MSSDGKLYISEIFHSAQGEGLRFGISSLFIRLSGCAKRCEYCDTKESWTLGNAKDLDQIESEIDSYSSSGRIEQVVITGGEPMEQNLLPLTKLLKRRGYFISIETSGTDYQDIEIDWWTVAPKDVSDYHVDKNIRPLIDEMKLIVNNNLSVDTVRNIRSWGPDFPIFLQPNNEDPKKFRDTEKLFRECLAQHIENIRLGMQLHRVYGIQ